MAFYAKAADRYTKKLISMDLGLRGRYNNISGVRVIIYVVITRIIIIVQRFRKV